MKTVSDSFKNAAVAPVKVVGGTVSLLDGSASYTENDYLQSITLESTGEMFGAVATIATFKLKGDNHNLEGKEVYIKYSLQTDNGFEDIDYGIYKVVQQSVSKNRENTEFTAHSKMLQMQEGNYAELEGFPMTVSEAVSEIASRESFSVTDMSGLPNAGYTIQEDLYKNINGANYRSIFAEVAGATGTMAVFNNTNNNLFFRQYQSTVQQSLDYSYLKKYEIGEHYGAINTLVLARTPQEDNIVVNDEAMIDAPSGKNILKDLLETHELSSCGITFTANGDGSYTLNGTNDGTGHSIYYLSNQSKPMRIKSGTYSGSVQLGNYSSSSVGLMAYNGVRYVPLFGNPQIFGEDDDWRIYLQVPRNSTTVYSNYKIYPQIEAGTHVTPYEPFVATGPKEVKLANNEILDDDRETLITPIFNAIKGMEWTGFEIETVGLGWLECGDRISITDDLNGTIEGIITYLKITIDGGIKETIKGVPPIKTETNYALAGGVMKTIYNTEIKVDKQGQEIQSIVSEQTAFENQTIENFTNITQNISSVITSVQGSGGNNLIKNSAFFASDDNGFFLYWICGSDIAHIPNEYQQVEYLQSNSGAFIDTGIMLDNNWEFETKAQFCEDISSEESAYLIGSANTTVNPVSLYRIGMESGNVYVQCGTYTQGYVSCDIPKDTNVHTFGIKDGYQYVDNIIKPKGIITNALNMSLSVFRMHNNGAYNGYGKQMRVYYLKMWNNGNLARVFVPCYRKIDHVYGLYDSVNNVFYTDISGRAEASFTGGKEFTAVVEPSAEASVYGSLSGQIIKLDDSSIQQIVTVKADDSSISEDDKTYYSFNCRCKKSTAGTASIVLSDGTIDGTWTIDFPNGTGALWEEYYIDGILPHSTQMTITVTGSAQSDFQITDMMFSVGNYHSQWQQASGESNNTQVYITTDGITVKNGNLATSWSRHNNQGFNAYKDRQLTASLNADEVIAPKAEFSKEIDMPPIKIVPQSDGWAFVSTIS